MNKLKKPLVQTNTPSNNKVIFLNDNTISLQEVSQIQSKLNKLPQ